MLSNQSTRVLILDILLKTEKKDTKPYVIAALINPEKKINYLINVEGQGSHLKKLGLLKP